MDAERGVLLVSMPWGSITEPSLGLGILKSVLHAEGVPCRVLDAPMRLLRHVKYETYEWIRNVWALNDFVFSGGLDDDVDGKRRQRIEEILRDPQGCVSHEYLRYANVSAQRDVVLALRNEIIPRFLDELVDEIAWDRYALVGFTCLFDQTIASIALARRIRAVAPDIVLAFGGYALQGEAGTRLQAAFPEMDVVVQGDGEPAIGPLFEACVGRRAMHDVPNAYVRGADGEVTPPSRRVQADLDRSPPPDYDDFFTSREALRDRHRVTFAVTEIPVESSRGCWWGQVSHCTFCGIDEIALRYRAKTPDVVLAQLGFLADRYGHRAFRFSDYIMPTAWFDELLPRLARSGAPWQLHYEVKANLDGERIRRLAAAGARCVQPGIESFATPVLSRMKKGVTALQNVFTIRTAMQHGVVCFYNILFGFPGDRPEDYADMLATVPALVHLLPPATVLPVLITRFAPLREDPERFGGRLPPRPHPRYEIVLGRRVREAIDLPLDALAYYFANPYPPPGEELAAIFTVIQHQVERWREGSAAGAFRLGARDVEDGIEVHDTRFTPNGETHHFGMLHREVGLALEDGVRSSSAVGASVASRLGARDAEVARAIEDLVDARIVLREGTRLVWLPLTESVYERGGCPKLLDDLAAASITDDVTPVASLGPWAFGETARGC
ncbi:MAG: RiPP maturation radical SAM protein 1 [Planctomycetes bacterium]|nr:RiPP maturation radical SAM protein 1 [Planctomycetota bacterium]